MRVLPGRLKANQLMAFSPDGRRLACGGNGRGVAIWDVTTTEPPTIVFSEAHGPIVLQFDANSGRLFAAFHTGDGGVRAFDPATKTEAELQFPGGRPSQIAGFALSPDGKSVVFSCYHSEMLLMRFDLDGDTVGKRAWKLREGYIWEGLFVFRPGTGDLFGHGGSGGSRTFVIRNPDEPERFTMHPYETGEREVVTGWALSPDGQRVAFTTPNRVRVMELATGTEVQLSIEPGSVGRAIAFHPGGQLVGVVSGDGVKLLDASTLAEVRALSWGNGRVRSLAFAPDGMTAATAGERGWLTLWDVDV